MLYVFLVEWELRSSQVILCKNKSRMWKGPLQLPLMTNVWVAQLRVARKPPKRKSVRMVEDNSSSRLKHWGASLEKERFDSWNMIPYFHGTWKNLSLIMQTISWKILFLNRWFKRKQHQAMPWMLKIRTHTWVNCLQSIKNTFASAKINK